MKIQLEVEGKDIVLFAEVLTALSNDKDLMKKLIPNFEQILTKMKETVADEKESA